MVKYMPTMSEYTDTVKASLSFEFDASNDFQPGYLRNNKSTASKNLRCFPSCSHMGHQERGFCGRSITGSLTVAG
jgi:hypothetical protein